MGRLKNLAAVIPPIRRLLKERDALRTANDELQREIWTLRHELKLARSKFLAAWQQHPDIWVPPGHFYSPIPAISDLKMNAAEIFALPPAIRGVRLNEEAQLDLLRQISAFYPGQPFAAQTVAGRRYFFENPNYSYNDAIVLYCMMRHVRPRRIVEIGSGYSSCAMLDVNELFFDDCIQCTFIDPYPQLLRDLIKESDVSRVRIIGQKVQDVSIDIFRELDACDILFIDSSHVTKTGSDVNYIIFKILPLLSEGVFIHFHDIFYPFEYPSDWVYEGRAWNEAYLLRAFLQYNSAFEIVFFNSYLIEKHRDVFEAAMPICLRRSGANLWLRKTAQPTELDRVNVPREKRIVMPPRSLDLTVPEHRRFLGDGWYEPEPEHCWMTQEAWFEIAAPASAGQRLTIRAVSPLDGSHLSATADGISLGSVPLGPAGSVAPGFPLPDELIGRSAIRVHLAIDRTHRVGGDPRKLGLAVNRADVG